jgi:Tol biopolymer transport system component
LERSHEESPGESLHVPFVICLKTSQPFEFFVNVFGIVTKLVSMSQAGTAANDDLGNFPDQVVSADGRVVAFVSVVRGLVPNDTNPWLDVFVRDVESGTTVLASVNRSMSNGGDASSGAPALSADGRFIAFSSDATNLVATPSGQCNIPASGGNIFFRDWQAGTTVLVSTDRSGNCANHGFAGPSVSADGRFVAFVSSAHNLTRQDIDMANKYTCATCAPE